MHGTDAPPPPSPTVFDVLDFLIQLRLQANASARVGLWLAGEVGIGFSTTDVLSTYGLDQADEVGLIYGGSAGLDWHMRNRHHSIGLQGGARVHSNLDGPSGDVAIGTLRAARPLPRRGRARPAAWIIEDEAPAEPPPSIELGDIEVQSH